MLITCEVCKSPDLKANIALYAPLLHAASAKISEEKTGFWADDVIFMKNH